MAIKFLVLAALASVAKGGVIGAPVAAPAVLAKVSDATVDPNPTYSFAYDVQDTLTGDSKTQVESRANGIVKGQYTVADPDGTRRIVDYYADPVHGFNAVVRKAPLAVAAPVVAKAVAAPVVAPAPVLAKAVAPAPVVAPAPAPLLSRAIAAPLLSAPAHFAVAPGLARVAAPYAVAPAPLAVAPGVARVAGPYVAAPPAPLAVAPGIARTAPLLAGPAALPYAAARVAAPYPYLF